jgi:predicted GIY-YIG superfamily endonuclease
MTGWDELRCRPATLILVYFESFSGIENAISREKQSKRWTREKKNLLIETNNPNWEDLGGHFPL